MAYRWSKDEPMGQVSCFFSMDTTIDTYQLKEWEYNINQKLKEASMEPATEQGRLWTHAYSAQGMVTLTNKKNTVEARAYGVGGDFFLFHPLTMIKGAYFSESDVMHDYVIIDEYAAWQLFGSNDVVGMQVDIAGIPHVIAGVTKRETDSLAKAAGAGEMIVYLSYESLQKYGRDYGISQYEVVLPNPVKNFAYINMLSIINMEDSMIEWVDNSNRFSLFSLLKIVANWKSRSMSHKGIIYPYWENMARGLEDVLAIRLLIGILSLLYPVIVGIIYLVKYLKRKTWTFRDLSGKVLQGLKYIWERCKSLQKKKRRKMEDEEFFT